MSKTDPEPAADISGVVYYADPSHPKSYYQDGEGLSLLRGVLPNQTECLGLHQDTTDTQRQSRSAVAFLYITILAVLLALLASLHPCPCGI